MLSSSTPPDPSDSSSTPPHTHDEDHTPNQKTALAPSSTSRNSLLIFPNELLLEIAKNLPQKSVHALLLSSRRLSTLLQPYLLHLGAPISAAFAPDAMQHYVVDKSIEYLIPKVSTIAQRQDFATFKKPFDLIERPYFHSAIILGRESLVRSFLHHGAGKHLNTLDILGATPLLSAVQFQHFEICRLLCDYGVDIDCRALLLAVWSRQNQILEMFLTYFDWHAVKCHCWGFSLLQTAVVAENWSAVEMLLEMGADLPKPRRRMVFRNTKKIVHCFDRWLEPVPGEVEEDVNSKARWPAWALQYLPDTYLASAGNTMFYPAEAVRYPVSERKWSK